ncbi:MAG TPA: ABC transporter permease [Candidatus Wallbacteria bacterium]|nr:ABC transporter permease [Candidatus Wallbacteria bacterium]
MMINPILGREVITLFRRPRTYFWITVYMSILVLVVFTSWPGSYGGQGIIDLIRTSRYAAVGILCVMMLLIFVILPSFMATTFTREKEENTLASLAVTQLTMFDIISGKIQVGIFYTLYLIMITIPLFGALYKLGGFAMSEIVQSYMIILIMSLSVCLWAMFFSVISATSYKAISRAYFFFFLLLILMGVFSAFLHDLGLGYIFSSAYINPFMSIEAIFFGSAGGRYSSFNLNLSKYSSQNLIFGFFYIETLKIIAFYGALSLILLLLIISAYRRLQHKWL